jgi:hypothetical protein
VYVNLFIPSELDWPEKGLRLRQETKYPESEAVSLRVTSGGQGPLAIRLRVPGWLRSAPTIKLNGKELESSAAPGSYFTLRRVWSSGDTIEMRLPMHLQAEAMPDDRGLQAFLYGPLVLAGDLGGEGLTEAHIIGPNLRVGFPQVAQSGSPLDPVNRAPAIRDVEIPSFRAAGLELTSWIKPADKPLQFRTTGQQKDVTMVPLNSLFDKRYSVYWRVS